MALPVHRHHSRASSCVRRWVIRGTPTNWPQRRGPFPAGSGGWGDRPGRALTGGAVGMYAYDLVRTVEPLGEPNPDPIGLPDLALMLTDVLVIFDHFKHTLTLLTTCIRRSRSWSQGTARLWRPGRSPGSSGRPGPAGHAAPPAPRRKPRPAQRDFFDRTCPRSSLQANVARSHRVHQGRERLPGGPVAALVGRGPVEGFSIFACGLESQPYMYFLDFGDFEIAGARPEP